MAKRDDWLLDIAQVKERVRLSPMTIARLERAGRFPQRRRVASRAVRWVKSEIDQWISARAE